jgi:hypothetical protein
MKRPNRDDKPDESLPGAFVRARRHGAHRKRPFEELQHGAAGGTVVLLRMIDDEECARGEAVLHRHNG